VWVGAVLAETAQGFGLGGALGSRINGYIITLDRGCFPRVQGNSVHCYQFPGSPLRFSDRFVYRVNRPYIPPLGCSAGDIPLLPGLFAFLMGHHDALDGRYADA
jgi:hypothetical protein